LLNDWCPMSFNSVMVSSSTVQISNEEIAWEYSTITRNTTMLHENVGHQSPMMWQHTPVKWRPEISYCEWVSEIYKQTVKQGSWKQKIHSCMGHEFYGRLHLLLWVLLETKMHNLLMEV
jgi:hypothetical protein